MTNATVVDAKPPVARQEVVLEWAYTEPNSNNVSAMRVRLPPGWEVPPEQFGNYYWGERMIHQEYVERCRTNKWRMQTQFLIRGKEDELIGFGHYTSEDPHDRALSDCAILQIEWELRGRGFFPTIEMDLHPVCVPDEFEQAIEWAGRMAKERKEEAKRLVEKYFAENPMPPFPGPSKNAPAAALPVSKEMQEVIRTNPGKVRLIVDCKDGTTRIERVQTMSVVGQLKWFGEQFTSLRFEAEKADA